MTVNHEQNSGLVVSEATAENIQVLPLAPSPLRITGSPEQSTPPSCRPSGFP